MVRSPESWQFDETISVQVSNPAVPKLTAKAARKEGRRQTKVVWPSEQSAPHLYRRRSASAIALCTSGAMTR